MRSGFLARAVTLLLVVLSVIAAGCGGGGKFVTVEKDGVRVSYPADMRRLDGAPAEEIDRILKDLPEGLADLARVATSRAMILAVSPDGRMVAVYEMGGESVTPEMVNNIGEEKFRQAMGQVTKEIVRSAASMLPQGLRAEVDDPEFLDPPKESGITRAIRLTMRIEGDVKGNRVRVEEHVHFLFTPRGLYLLEVAGDKRLAEQIFSSVKISK